MRGLDLVTHEHSFRHFQEKFGSVAPHIPDRVRARNHWVRGLCQFRKRRLALNRQGLSVCVYAALTSNGLWLGLYLPVRLNPFRLPHPRC